LTREIIGTGTENGVDYIEIKYSGTATGTVASLVPEGSTQIVATPSQVWTFSSFIKSVSGSPNSYLLRILERTDAGVYVTDSASSALSVTSTLSRFSFTRTNSANVTTARVQPQIDFVLTIGASYDFTVRIGWPQMETGSVATSPIVTTAGTASRVGDVVTLASASSVIGQSAGTLYVEAERIGFLNNLVERLFNVTDGSASANRIMLLIQENTKVARLIVTASSVAQADIVGSTLVSGVFKMAGAYATDDVALYLNGASVGTDTSATIPACNRVNIGTLETGATGTATFNGWIRSVALFPTRLDNTTLATLTTL
jgi:hypothetical protein